MGANTGNSETRLDDEGGWLVSSVFSVDYSTNIGKQQTGHWPVATKESLTKLCFCNI
jgi:hypothetical protein